MEKDDIKELIMDFLKNNTTSEIYLAGLSSFINDVLIKNNIYPTHNDNDIKQCLQELIKENKVITYGIKNNPYYKAI